VLKAIAGSAAAVSVTALLPQTLHASEIEDSLRELKLKGRINHSVCKWCYPNIPLEDLCKAAKKIGLSSIELLTPDEWPILKKYDLTCAMPWGAEKGLLKGFNDPTLHDELVTRYEVMIPKVANAGLKQIICFSGARNGMSDEQGLENCAKGLKRLIPLAEKHKITISMELLNSKETKDYQCDHTAWGVELVKMVGSDQFKLLYDIYHMQMMEGDVIATIRHPILIYLTTIPQACPEDMKLMIPGTYYPAIMKAIVETGYKGFVGQEFIPKQADALASLKKSIQICDV
jgi:hydroxypyruvate isomerase